MWSLLLFFQLLRAVASNQVRQVHGFLGESVTLTPGLGLTPGNISYIKWLILSNDTWIATYRDGETKTDHFWQYTGRLSLNTSSGDLMIKNLIRKDDMKYVLEVGLQGDKEICRKFVLRVEQRLARPNVTVQLTPENGSCMAVLRCSSTNPRVTFTWRAPLPEDVLTRFVHQGSSFLVAPVGADGEVNFTCDTASDLESTSTALAVRCGPGPEPIKEIKQSQNFLHGVLLGGGLGIVLALMTYIFREHIEAFIKCRTKKQPDTYDAVRITPDDSGAV